MWEVWDLRRVKKKTNIWRQTCTETFFQLECLSWKANCLRFVWPRRRGLCINELCTDFHLSLAKTMHRRSEMDAAAGWSLHHVAECMTASCHKIWFAFHQMIFWLPNTFTEVHSFVLVMSNKPSGKCFRSWYWNSVKRTTYLSQSSSIILQQSKWQARWPGSLGQNSLANRYSMRDHYPGPADIFLNTFMDNVQCGWISIFSRSICQG